MPYSIIVDLDPDTTYDLGLEAIGYKTLAFSHTTGTADETITKTLIPIISVNVFSSPLGASVYVDDKLIGETPLTAELE